MVNFTTRCFCIRNNLNLKVLKPIVSSKVTNSQRSYASALYIPGNKAHKTFAYLSPDFEYDNCLENIEKLQKELNLRGSQIDAKELKKTWEFYQYINSNRHTLEKKHAEISNQIKVINEKKDSSPEAKQEIEALIVQSRLVKQDLKTVKEAAWELEETVVPQVLKLPNEIDERTPPDSSIVLKSSGEKPSITENKKENHLDIGKKLGLLDYKNPIQCYLSNEAALFELEVLSLAGRILKENGATRVAGPDFCRSIIVEGSGMDHESSTESFILQNIDGVDKEYLLNRLHLVGGASLPALLAIFTKQSMKQRCFPLKIFATGRQYTPFPNISATYGLFSVCQASAANALTLVETKNSEEYKDEFEKLIEFTSKIFHNIGCHYRIVIRSAKELNAFECMRISFEMWSVYSNQYIEVGHVSACGDYFSKRLLIGYQSSNKSGYPAVITGTLLSVPRVLGCLIEENPERFVLPEKVTGFI